MVCFKDLTKIDKNAQVPTHEKVSDESPEVLKNVKRLLQSKKMSAIDPNRALARVIK